MHCELGYRRVSEPYIGGSATNGYGGITLEARLSGSRSGAPRSCGASARFAEAVVQRVRMRSHLFARGLAIARASRGHAGERKINRAASMWMRLDARRSPRSRGVSLHFRRSNSRKPGRAGARDGASPWIVDGPARREEERASRIDAHSGSARRVHVRVYNVADRFAGPFPPQVHRTK